MASTSECVFCGRAWEPGVVSHSREHIWSQWIRKHAGELPAERVGASTGLEMDPHGLSFSELPLVVTRGKSSVLTQITREVCEDCNHELGRQLEDKIEPAFLDLAHAAEDISPLSLPVEDARLLARWAEKMAITNELTASWPKVATSEMGQAILGGETIRSAAVWAARHPADYMLGIAASRPGIAATETPVRGELERHALITVVWYHYLSLLVFIPGPGGPYVPPNPLPLAPDLWTLIWPVRRDPEFPPMAAVDAREIERTLATRRRIGAAMHAGRGPVLEVTFGPNGRLLGTVGSDGSARIWSVATDRQTGKPLATNGVIAMAFSPDGKLVADVGAGFGWTRMMSVATHHQVGILMSAGATSAFGVAFTPGGTTLVTTDTDGAIRQWSVATHHQIRPRIAPKGHPEFLFAAISPDGKILATTQFEGPARLWILSRA